MLLIFEFSASPRLCGEISFFVRNTMDFHQLWTIVSTPDNVPIVLLLFLVPFYTWYGLRQAFANDRLIAQLEARSRNGQDPPPQDSAL